MAAERKLTDSEIARPSGSRRPFSRARAIDDARPWTIAEITEIRSASENGLQPNDVAQKRHRSVDAVRRKACDLGCPFARPNVTVVSPPPLSAASAARNYAAVVHKLERLRSENVAVQRGTPVVVPVPVIQRGSSSICADAVFGGAERVRITRAG